MIGTAPTLHPDTGGSGTTDDSNANAGDKSWFESLGLFGLTGWAFIGATVGTVGAVAAVVYWAVHAAKKKGIASIVPEKTIAKSSAKSLSVKKKNSFKDFELSDGEGNGN